MVTASTAVYVNVSRSVWKVNEVKCLAKEEFSQPSELQRMNRTVNETEGRSSNKTKDFIENWKIHWIIGQFYSLPFVWFLYIYLLCEVYQTVLACVFQETTNQRYFGKLVVHHNEGAMRRFRFPVQRVLWTWTHSHGQYWKHARGWEDGLMNGGSGDIGTWTDDSIETVTV